MKQILEEMRANGLAIDSAFLELNGKVHRFSVDSSDQKKSGWYCGFQNYTRQGGEQFFVVRYGNFKTGDVFQFQSDVESFSTDDRKAVREQIEKAKKAADGERRKEQERVSEECQALWEELEISEILPEYLNRKKIDQLYGCRVRRTLQGMNFYIPMKDEHGKLWSMQKIQADGGKFFQPGGRVQGTFHVIGNLENESVIYIAEGFATAASVHMAIGKSVVVAFQASNLITVAEVLKKKYTEKTFVICGDDDIFTHKPDGTDWNPGREKAEEAAKKVLGVAVFPKFRTLEKGKTTDFNDLHVREGLDKVKDEIEQAKPEKFYVVPLGYDGGDYYLLSNTNPQIQKLSAAALGTASGLCRLQPLQFWESLYPAKNDNGVAWQKAADNIMQDCHRRGVFKPDRVRGRGVWNDEEKIIYHMGDRLYYGGSEQPLHRNSLRSKYIYESSEGLPPVHSNPLTVEDCASLLAAAKNIRWKKPNSFMLYCGWLAIAPIGGALPWRPHLWITGPSGSGKSFVMQELTYPLLREFSLFLRGQTTEAGLRQKSGRSTLPVIFDEFETNDDRSSDRIKALLELARQASSESDGIVAKGTTSGDAMEFRPQFSMIVGSVRVNLVHEEDQNRFTVLELARGTPSAEQLESFEVLTGLVKDLGPEYGRRLFARSFYMADTIRKSAGVLQHVISEKYPMRVGQQYGTLIAGLWSLISDEVITQEKAIEMRETFDFSVASDTVERNDEMECLNYLLEHVVQTDIAVELPLSIKEDRVKRSIQELILDSVNLKKPSDAIQRLGITLDLKNNFVCIASQHKALSEVYSRSKWQKYSDQLSRIKGAKKNEAKWFPLLGKSVKCVTIPIDQIFQSEE